MIRYSSVEEVNAALIELDENEQTVSSEKANSEKHSDTEKPSSRTNFNSVSANGKRSVNGNEENGGLHEDIDDSDTDSGSGTIDREGHDEEDLDEENHDEGSATEEEEDGGGPASDEDDEVHVRQKVAEGDPLEAANFEQELRAVLQESMEQRRQELRGRPILNMVIPMNLFEGSIRDHHGRMVGGESGDEALDEEAGGSKEVQVKVLVKRGNKQQTKQMYIPSDCSLVQSTKQKEAAEIEEKQDIKRLVLEYNDREEEESNGLGNQTLNWIPSGNSRAFSRSSTWEGGSGRVAGSRQRHQHHSGSGVYHGRRR
uniref:Up-frameshift suppressor 2 C-terminal domain-containing protein n=1 Tax=Rhizophora mucronata TaxID=61149 RepID=A0A2P2L861_RHIMU